MKRKFLVALAATIALATPAMASEVPAGYRGEMTAVVHHDTTTASVSQRFTDAAVAAVARAIDENADVRTTILSSGNIVVVVIGMPADDSLPSFMGTTAYRHDNGTYNTITYE